MDKISTRMLSGLPVSGQVADAFSGLLKNKKALLKYPTFIQLFVNYTIFTILFCKTLIGCCRLLEIPTTRTGGQLI
jgi:hypothetical protein